MFIFSCIAELFGYLICTINDRIGRKKAIMIYFILSGIICLVTSFVPRNQDLNNKDKVIADAVIIIILVSIGKCMASAAFNTCYVFTAEYYQTNVRNFAILFVSCIGNIGGFISPQVNLSKILWKSLPYLIFSSFSLVGSLAIFLLPKIKEKPKTMSTLTVETNELTL
jgi:nitrate/nitrite transporter NarK